MKKVLLTILGTAVVFGSGVVSGIWIQKTQPIPPPPMGLMGELKDVPLSGTGRDHVPHDKSQLRAELERLKPDIEAFRKKLEPIKSEFRQNLEALLNSEQRAKLNTLSERITSAGRPESEERETQAGTKPDDRRRRAHEGLNSMFPIVLVPVTLDRLTQELQLNDTQRSEVHELLLKRRTEFLELVDTNPPPSVRLGQLAPLVPALEQGAPTHPKE